MDRIIGEDCNMSIITEMILGEIISEMHKVIEVKILEVDIEEIIEMTILKEIEVGLEKNNTQIILIKVTKVVVGQDQVWELVLTEIESDALSVGNMIIFTKEYPNLTNRKGTRTNTNKCII